MKGVSAEILLDSYVKLQPGEAISMLKNRADAVHTVGNWLSRYKGRPELALAVSNKTWAGKMTRALFDALGIKCPKTKGEMYKALEISAFDLCDI